MTATDHGADCTLRQRNSTGAPILVTGGAGYVGSGLVRDLLDKGQTVVCVDSLMFGGESLLDVWRHPNFIFYKADINDAAELNAVVEKHRYWAVVHLAAIVGDPACRQNAGLAEATNWHSSKRLIDKARAHGVERFVFASTCSNYGKMADPDAYVVEDSELAPVSLYAELKVKFERYLLDEIGKTESFCPTSLRFSTVYGVSPRMRFDLTVNEFTKDLALGRELVVFGEQFWRPYCHVRDFANAIIAILSAAPGRVAYDVFNVGSTAENYTKKMIVEEICGLIPSARIKYVKKEEDPRDYRVNCDKIRSTLGFDVSLTVKDGISEIKDIVQTGVIRSPDDQRYYNIPYTYEEPV